MGKPKSSKCRVKIRRRWKIDPRTKIKQSAKGYRRAKQRQETRKVVKNESKTNT